MNIKIPDELQPGDCMLFRPSSFFGVLIALKTFCRISHVEVYIGDGKSFASRDGVGVGIYPVRVSGLTAVRRPSCPLPNFDAGMAWAKSVVGEAYDFKDLFTFLAMGKPVGDENKMICSEAATWFYREAGYEEIVNKDVSAEAISPSDLYKTGSLYTVWSDGKA